MQDPLSIRVDRPYVTEEAFLESEAWSVNARNMLLIGVDSIPEGTALRCELRLGNGHALIVAEGYAVKHLSATATRPAGLVVRYKRMSAASTEFVKRAVAHNSESRTGSSPIAAVAPKTKPPPAPRAPSVRPPQSSKPPPRRPSASPPQSSSVVPPPRPTRSPSAQPSMKPPVPVRKSSKPPSLTPPRRTSVLPSAPRASTIPPSITKRRSGAPEAIPPEPASRLSTRPIEAESLSTARSARSAYIGTHQSDQTSQNTLQRAPIPSASGSKTVPASARAHDMDAIQRLRSRVPSQAISAPPDREAVLSRLKNKPIA